MPKKNMLHRKSILTIRREAHAKGKQLKMSKPEIERTIRELLVRRAKQKIDIADVEGKKGDHTATKNRLK